MLTSTTYLIWSCSSTLVQIVLQIASRLYIDVQLRQLFTLLEINTMKSGNFFKRV